MMHYDSYFVHSSYPRAEETVQLNSKSTYGHPSLVIRCKTSHVALITLHMLYLTALIIASNVISLLTIKFPANFREVVYIDLLYWNYLDCFCHYLPSSTN